MSTYLIIDLLVLGAPLLMTLFFKKKLGTLNFKAFLKAFLLVGSFFIIWDIIFTYIGVWSFSKQYTLGHNLIGLPLEEILFFFAIPFASLALFELINSMFKDRVIKFNRKILLSLSLILILSSFYLLFLFKIYTGTVLLLLGLLLLWYYRCNKEGIIQKNQLLFFLLSFIPFFIVNSILTGLPVVSYSDTFNSGIRIGTIPIEDFIYSFLMLAMFLIVYQEELKKHSS